MNTFNVAVALLGLLVLALGLWSDRLARSPLPPALLALLVGIAIGPEGAGLIDIARLGDRATIMEYVARLTIGIALIGVALRVPAQFPRRNARGLAVLIGVGMLLMWAITTALVFGILGLPFWVAALTAAVVTPTDPIASSPIVTGVLANRHIPADIRDTISFESGANDGLAYLLILLPFLMLTREPGAALTHWLTHTILWEVIAATAIGYVIGVAAGRLLQRAERNETIEDDWRLIYTVALGLLAVGAGRIIDTDELLLVFAAGAGFVQVVSEHERQEEEHGQEAVNRFFAVPILALLGTVLPWAGWRELGWRGVALAVAILALRRVPVILLLKRWIPGVHTLKQALFVGWFGPIAIAALYYASLMEHRLQDPLVWHVASLVICASVVAHGVTGALLTRRLDVVNDEDSNEDRRPGEM